MSELEKRTESRDAPAWGGGAFAPHQTLFNRLIDPQFFGTMGSGQSFVFIYYAGPKEKISVIKQGLPAEHVGALAEVMDMPKETLITTLRLSRASINRKARNTKALSQDETERVLGVESLIGQVEAMLIESGDPTGFDAAKWTSTWLNSPLPALDNQTPASYMDTIEGQKMISTLLATAQTGAYA